MPVKCRMAPLVCAFLGAVILMAAGCLRPALPPPSSFDLSAYDVGAVRGKTIVIDPGHGGVERGAVGKQGLAESEANLGVALYLWGLLKRAGARPLLTRSSDTSVANGRPFSLKQDLQARCDFSNRYNADIFVSIHHNASDSDARANDLVIFHKLADAGRSRDLAREICSALSDMLQPELSAIRAGNYHVLRSTDAPAILGEASFVSNRPNETRLFFQRILRAEAQGYFIGIVSYFGKGIPAVARMQPRDDVLKIARPSFSAVLLSGSRLASIDRASVRVTLDSRTVSTFAWGADSTVTFAPDGLLSNGRHRWCVAARNSAGNISDETCSAFTVDMPPASVSIAPLFPVIPADGLSCTPVDVEVLDEYRRPVLDGTRVSLSADGGDLRDSILTTHGGRARTFYAAGEKLRTFTLSARSGDAVGSCSGTAGIPEDALLMVTLRDTDGRAVRGAKLFRNDMQVGLSDDNGFVFDRVVPSGNMDYIIRKKGFRPLLLSPEMNPGALTVENVLATPIAGGLFFGRTIMVDPAGSALDAVPLAMELKKLIENAGGTAPLTWTNPPAPSATERVLYAQRVQPDIFITIDRGTRRLAAGHYYKSRCGKLLADTLCRHLSESPFAVARACRSEPAGQYVVMHTPMPAVWISVPAASNEALPPIAQRLFQGLKEIFSRDSEQECRP